MKAPPAAAARTTGTQPMLVAPDAVVFPVGHYLGANHLGDGEAPSHVVRAGWQLHELDSERFAVWGLAHGVAEGEPMRPWTASDTAGGARVVGVADAHALLGELIARELILTVRHETDPLDVVHGYRLRGLLRGLGPDADGQHLLGLAPGQPSVAVEGFTFEVWKWAPHCDDLWHLCQILAHAAGDPDDGERFVRQCLESVQVLIAHGAGYLDPARVA